MWVVLWLHGCVAQGQKIHGVFLIGSRHRRNKKYHLIVVGFVFLGWCSAPTSPTKGSHRRQTGGTWKRQIVASERPQTKARKEISMEALSEWIRLNNVPKRSFQNRIAQANVSQWTTFRAQTLERSFPDDGYEPEFRKETPQHSISIRTIPNKRIQSVKDSQTHLLCVQPELVRFSILGLAFGYRAGKCAGIHGTVENRPKKWHIEGVTMADLDRKI